MGNFAYKNNVVENLRLNKFALMQADIYGICLYIARFMIILCVNCMLVL